MPDYPIPISSNFAIIDIKAGRGFIRKRIEKAGGDNARIPVVIRGHIDRIHSRDDGISQEFSIAVVSAVKVPSTKIIISDIEYDRAKSLELRERVIDLRNALHGSLDKHGDMAVYLTHLASWMTVVIDERWPEMGKHDNQPKSKQKGKS
jgi:hypothetical protein